MNLLYFDEETKTEIQHFLAARDKFRKDVSNVQEISDKQKNMITQISADLDQAKKSIDLAVQSRNEAQEKYRELKEKSRKYRKSLKETEQLCDRLTRELDNSSVDRAKMQTLLVDIQKEVNKLWKNLNRLNSSTDRNISEDVSDLHNQVKECNQLVRSMLEAPKREKEKEKTSRRVKSRDGFIIVNQKVIPLD